MSFDESKDILPTAEHRILDPFLFVFDSVMIGIVHGRLLCSALLKGQCRKRLIDRRRLNEFSIQMIHALENVRWENRGHDSVRYFFIGRLRSVTDWLRVLVLMFLHLLNGISWKVVVLIGVRLLPMDHGVRRVVVIVGDEKRQRRMHSSSMVGQSVVRSIGLIRRRRDTHDLDRYVTRTS